MVSKILIRSNWTFQNDISGHKLVKSKKKNQYILVIKFEYFLFSLYRALSLKGNHILVQKWPRPSSRLKLFFWPKKSKSWMYRERNEYLSILIWLVENLFNNEKMYIMQDALFSNWTYSSEASNLFRRWIWYKICR